jgi:hypothetical protein
LNSSNPHPFFYPPFCFKSIVTVHSVGVGVSGDLGP